VVDSKGKISAFNQRFLTLWQIPNDILESRDDEKAIAIVLDQLLDPEAFLEKVTYLYGRPEEGSFDLIEFKDGKIFERYSLPQKIGDTIVGRVWSFSDVTDRKRYEEQLRDSDEKTRLLVEQSPVGIAIFQDGNYCYANPELLTILGCESEDQVIGQPIIRFVAPGHQRLFIERCKRHLEGKSGRPSYQVEGIRRNGALLDMVLWPRKIDYGGQPAILAFVMDVTETKNLRNQLVRAQKMEAIGTLAGGIAHDFNNLLQVIIGYSELIAMNPALPDQFSRGVKSINNAAVNGADLVRRLLTFARKTESSAEPLNLNDKIKQIRELLDRTIPKMIQIELKLSKYPAEINADASQIDQIIMNLAVNAGHAMPEGGNLVIETKAVSLDRAYCLDHIEATIGPYILLSVSDTGHGIDKKTMERIFEPFFTTKGPGIGTGLGLSMVYGIVKQHGGHITCYSEPGAGATFKIYFPAIDFEVKSEKATDSVVPQGGTETILLVDDDDSVRDVGTQMLVEYGYRVITASNGREALEIYRARRETISLVILDLFMPEMGGKECLRALLRMDPKVSVLVASGFTQNGQIAEALDSGARGFIGKPFDIPQLLEKIRKIIAG
jgi:PAS domain S-box-containing protein